MPTTFSPEPESSSCPSATLKLIEKAEFGELIDDEYVFTHTAFLYTNGVEFFRARIPRRIPSQEHIALTELRGHRIPLNDIYPPFDEHRFTLAPLPLSPATHLKRQSMNFYFSEGDNEQEDAHIRQLISGEAEVCEKLRRFPHRNIAEYLGCIVEHGRIVALCYRRYTESLEQRVQSTNWDVDLDFLLGGIRSGIEHLHSIGYCHNDIHPGNIMFGESDTPIIIDFDSCRPTGDELGPKAGKPGFFPEGTQTSQRQNDFYGLNKVEALIREALNR